MKRLDLPRIAAWTALAVFLGWSLARLSVGDLSVVGVLSLTAAVAAMVGLGELVATFAIGPMPSWVPPASVRLVAGIATWAVAQVVLTLVLPEAICFWAVTLVGAGGLVRALWRRRRYFAAAPQVEADPGAGQTGTQTARSWVPEVDALGLAMLFRAATQITDWVSTTPTTISLLRHHDLVFHLAAVKQLIYRGIPATQSPYLAGAVKVAYHPTFDTFAAQLISGTGAPVDSALFRFVLPLVAVVFLASIGLLSAALVRRFEASLLGICVMLVPFALWRFQPQSLEGLGPLGRNTVRFFMNNPPAAFALPVMATAVLSVALAEKDPGRRAALRLGTAGVFATALLATKANAAVAFLPAFVIVVAVGWLRKRWRFRDAVWAAAACLATLPAILVLISGGGQPVGVRWGAYVAYLETLTPIPPRLPLLQRLAHSLLGAGPFADAAYLAAHLLVDVAVFAVPAAVVWLAVWLLGRRRARGVVIASAVTVELLGTFSVLAVIVGLTVVQPGIPGIGLWNIAGHTVANLLWVSAAFLAAGLTALVVRTPKPRPLVMAWLVVVLGVACVAGAAGFTMSYGVWWHRASRAVYTLVERLQLKTPKDAVVAQTYDTESIQWVSGFGGRLSPLEAARYPAAAVARRKMLLSQMYGAATPAGALDAARALGVDFAIVDSREGQAVLRAGRIVDRAGAWVLVDLRGSRAATSTP